VQREEVFDEVEAAAPRHGEVGDNEVGPLALHGSERLGHACGEPTDGEVRLGGEHELVAVEHHAVIVHEHDAEISPARPRLLKPPG